MIDEERSGVAEQDGKLKPRYKHWLKLSDKYDKKNADLDQGVVWKIDNTKKSLTENHLRKAN